MKQNFLKTTTLSIPHFHILNVGFPFQQNTFTMIKRESKQGWSILERSCVSSERLSAQSAAQREERAEGNNTVPAPGQKTFKFIYLKLKNKKFWRLQVMAITFSPLCDPVAHWANYIQHRKLKQILANAVHLFPNNPAWGLITNSIESFSSTF